MPMEFEVRIPKATWAAGAAQNAGLNADLALADVVRGVGGNPISGVAGGNARNQIKSLSIVAQDNHAFDLLFFSHATRYPANRDQNTFLAKFSFTAGGAVQDTNDTTTSWYYYVDGNDIPIRDDDNKGQLHVTLIDRTVGGLTAGHDVVIELRLAPLSQFP